MRRANSTRIPFLMLNRICWFPGFVPDEQHHSEMVVARHRRNGGELEAVRRRVDELAAFDERCRLRQPRGIQNERISRRH